METDKKLVSIVGEGRLSVNEPMSRHTTFRIGGPADYFVLPSNIDQLRRVIEICRGDRIPYYILGNGSNLLVGDKGYRGVMIQIYRNMEKIKAEEHRIYAQAGALLSKIAAKALEKSLTGFEFASGIPGTLGGAVRMNAGAYGGEMSQVIESAEVLMQGGEIKRLTAEELELGYRTSVIARKKYVVLEAALCLKPGNADEIRSRMEELKERRITKQPIEMPSAGSTFKRPEGNFAGKLIEEAGFRGFCVGGAKVSDKHCGFIVNTGNATALEVSELIKQIIDKVEAMSGIRLEPEVRMIGEF